MEINDEEDATTVSIYKEGWLHKRGEHIKTWRPRYFILKSNGHFLGYNNRPSSSQETNNHNNLFYVKNCKIATSDKPKLNVFIVQCAGNQKSSVERFFASSNRLERDQWISAIQEVSSQLDGKSVLKQAKKETGKITLHDFEFLKILGKGTFGKVVLCRELSTKRLCAMKILKKSLIVEKNEIVHTTTENKVMRNIKHPFITSLIYSFQTVDRLCLVMEYVNGGELFFHLAREKRFSEAKSKFYCAEICYAIGYLHQKNIIYRDIKLENVLLDSEGHIKLADFGLCKMDMDCNSKTSTFCGTLEYLAPEILTKEENGKSAGYTRAVDWWAVGVLLYEMLVGRLPFSSKCSVTKDQDSQSLFGKILNEAVYLPLDMGKEAKIIVCQLLEKNANRRLGSSSLDFEEIRGHSFFRSIDWFKLERKELEPPFKPMVSSDTDTCYFEKEFTGEHVQLTPTNNDNPITLFKNHFDSFSFYGSVSSLASEKSHSSNQSSASSSDTKSSDKFDVNSLQGGASCRISYESPSRSVLKRNRLISHSSLNEEATIFHRLAKKTDESYLLASSAFPNIVQFTDDSGHLRQTQAYFENEMDAKRMSTDSFSLSKTSSAPLSCHGNSSSNNYQNIFMQALLKQATSCTDLVIDEKMEG